MLKRPTEDQAFEMLVRAWVDNMDPVAADEILWDHCCREAQKLSDQEIMDELEDMGAFEQYEEDE